MRNGSDRREVVQVLLMALTIISTVGTVVSSLAALRIFPQRDAKPPTIVIVVNDVKPGMARGLAELVARHQDELRELIESESVIHAPASGAHPVAAQPL